MNTEIRKSVLKGIIVKSDGMKVELSSCKVNVAGREIIIKSPVIFQIEPLGIKEIKNENHEATRDSNVSYSHPCKLKECCMEGSLNLLPGILVPGSVIVKSSSGVIYQLDTDYKVSEKWPCVWISSDESGTSRIKDKQEIFVDYKYSMARIDTIFVSKGGDIKLQKGIEKRESPKPAELDKDCIPMINIYLPFNTNNITERNIYPVGSLPADTEKEIKRKTAFVSKTLGKLKSGQPVKIVFWGDSVTKGGDASPIEKAFAYLFPKVLQAKFPDSKIEAINNGIGGSNTSQRLPDFKKDVLDNKPDLTVIEFINDTGFPYPPDMIYEHYGKIISELKQTGSEIILITPHIALPGIYGNFDVIVDAWREIAKNENIGLCDVTKAWGDIALTGIPPESLLYNGINHPDNQGHRIFVDELMKFFS